MKAVAEAGSSQQLQGHSSSAGSRDASPSFRTPGSPMSPIPNLQRSPTRASRNSSRASARKSFGDAEPLPLTPEQVATEIEALVAVMREASYTELESAFHAGVRKQVGSLQLSHLFATMGLSVSPKAVKEIERLADVDGNGTLSKQELLDWLDGKALTEPSRLPQIPPPSRALERLGMLPAQASNTGLRHPLRSFHALSLFDTDANGEVGVDDLCAAWKLLMEENLTRNEACRAVCRAPLDCASPPPPPQDPPTSPLPRLPPIPCVVLVLLPPLTPTTHQPSPPSTAGQGDAADG